MPDIYSERPNLYIGFHGCEKDKGLQLIDSPNNITSSTTNHEWLGKGFYVWENNRDRALDWAINHRPKPFQNPFVIGVVYTLGNCLDLTDKHFIDLLSSDYKIFERDMKMEGMPIPQNEDPGGRQNPAGLLRKLDCAVIEHLQIVSGQFTASARYDSVRGAFYEGAEAYPGTQIREKNHIQVCIRNMNCIKGFFLPRS